ncbi:MAG: hypothetical protein PQJ50_04980 [Spirochaetales bacterium]|nr:hypothetical protein [Spirochaetales bacterium]
MRKLLILISLALLFLGSCSTGTENQEALAAADAGAAEGPGTGMPDGMPPGEAPGGAPPGMSSTSKESASEGYWSFDIVTVEEQDSSDSYAVITYYAGKTDEIVIVPSILGGAEVREIAPQAFGHHSEIRAVYLPDTVSKVEDWGFYDLNEALIISFANPEVEIGDGAFQSSGNAALYLPESSSITEAGGKVKTSVGSTSLTVQIENPLKAAIAGGSYLNVEGSYSISAADVISLAVPADSEEGSVDTLDGRVVFSGPDYEVEVERVSIYEGFTGLFGAEDLKYTFRSLSPSEAAALNGEIAADSSYAAVSSLLEFAEGYYLNGTPVTLDRNAAAWNAETGEAVEKNAGGYYPSTGQGQFKYVACIDSDDDGDIDELYYSPFSLSYSYNTLNIISDNENLNGLSARDLLNPVYLSFANSVVKADGESILLDYLEADTGVDGDSIGAGTDQERSLIWATNYGSVEVGTMHGTSGSFGNWAKMSYETGLDSYKVEIMMEWGMNALLYATNGGRISVGDPDGEISTFTASGDGANGIIAGGAGTLGGTPDAPNATAEVYLYNASLDLTGWNNHVADVVYGGYAYLEDISSTTGLEGSYSVGQASALANDFGNGVVDAVNFHTTVYGNRSAGAYVIGGGVITAVDSSFRSLMDAGLVSASGGTFDIENSTAVGQIAFRNRGGAVADTLISVRDSVFRVERDLSAYVTGDKALQAVEAWEKASGGRTLLHAYMSDPEMTIGTLCDLYGIGAAERDVLMAEFSGIAGEEYSPETALRLSVLDNTFYNYSAGAYTGSTDFSEVPYLTVGSSFGGLVSAVFEFESAGETLDISNTLMENTNGPDYDYLIASEAGSEVSFNFDGCDVSGLIWNEGDVNRAVEGRPGDRSSSLSVSFTGSSFSGSFADGSRGLWSVEGLEYTAADGELSGLNGNYYGAEANGGISASFDADSEWLVTADSYLGTLTLEKGAELTAPEGYKLQMMVDGKKTRIRAGEYTGDIEILLVEK